MNYKLYAAQVMPHTGELPPAHSFVSLKPENLVLTAMKKSEDGDSLILRFYEWAGRQTQAQIAVPAGAKSATETDLMEREVEGANTTLPLSKNTFEVPVGPTPSIRCASATGREATHSGRLRNRQDTDKKSGAGQCNLSKTGTEQS